MVHNFVFNFSAALIYYNTPAIKADSFWNFSAHQRSGCSTRPDRTLNLHSNPNCFEQLFYVLNNVKTLKRPTYTILEHG